LSPRRQGRRQGSGEEASRTIVNIWDVLARSESPMAVEEIAAELSRRGLRDSTDAVMFHKQQMAAKLDAAAAKALVHVPGRWRALATVAAQYRDWVLGPGDIGRFVYTKALTAYREWPLRLQ